MVKSILDALHKEKVKIYLMYLILYSVFCTISLIQGIPKGDERGFHLPTAVNMNEDLLGTIFGNGYLSANTPLPYIIIIIAGKLFGINVTIMRIITAIVSFIAIVLFTQLLRMRSQHPRYYISLPFFFYPYFLMFSFVFYTPVYGVLFFFLALRFLFDTENITSQFLFGISSSFAILSQQFYIVVPFGVMAWRIWMLFKSHREADSIIKQIVPFLIMSIPLLLPLWLFIKWGGLVHPLWQQHSIEFHIENITAVFVVIGLVFIPLVVSNLKRIKTKTVLILVPMSLVLGIFFSPKWSDKQGSGLFPGITFHILNIIENFSQFASLTLMTLLVFSGFLLTLLLFENCQNDWEKQVFFIGVLLIVVYSFNTIIGEKHLLGLVALLFLLMLPRLKQAILKVYIFGMCGVGIPYFFYWLYFKNN